MIKGKCAAKNWSIDKIIDATLRPPAPSPATAASEMALAADDEDSISSIGELRMSLGTILLIVLILMLIGGLPTWPHSRSWGYYPSAGLGTILVIVLVLVVLGRI